jgi:hypothetical protein
MSIRNKPPSMLTLTGLLAPVERAEARIKEIWLAATKTDGSVIVDHGLFVLMVATFEVMLSDCLRYYLTHRPDKLEFKDEKFETDRLLASPLTRDLVPPKVEKKIRQIGYRPLRKAVNYITRTLDISKPAFPRHAEDALDALVEIKETRNLLLHNDLIVNQDYKERAGRFLRQPEKTRRGPDRLSISSEYLVTTYGHIENVIREFRQRLTDRYNGCTRLAFFRQLWEYLFNSDFAKFDDFWKTNAQQDRIQAILHWDAECQLGGRSKCS